jgi:hypothetical protein
MASGRRMLTGTRFTAASGTRKPVARSRNEDHRRNSNTGGYELLRIAEIQKATEQDTSGRRMCEEAREAEEGV